MPTQSTHYFILMWNFWAIWIHLILDGFTLHSFLFMFWKITYFIDIEILDTASNCVPIRISWLKHFSLLDEPAIPSCSIMKTEIVDIKPEKRAWKLSHLNIFHFVCCAGWPQLCQAFHASKFFSLSTCKPFNNKKRFPLSSRYSAIKIIYRRKLWTYYLSLLWPGRCYRQHHRSITSQQLTKHQHP